ncbi:MAG: hypothetical protein PVF58_18515 [Candidatus Methanofastidiosia archaeon]
MRKGIFLEELSRVGAVDAAHCGRAGTCILFEIVKVVDLKGGGD